MIKNVVFDIGNVLVDFRWRALMDELGISKEVQDIFENSVFGSAWWETLDHGTLEEDEALAKIREDNKEYLNEFHLVWNNRDRIVASYDYSVSWIKELKERGYKVYLLSNYPKLLFTLHEQKGVFTFLPYVDGKVVSAFEKKIKPDPDIYECLLERYGLKAEECIFIDDRKDNVEGALRVGMNAIHFESYEQATDMLNKAL